MNYKISIYLESPVCISQNHKTGNEISTLDYITGRTIRGALAHEFIRQHGQESVADDAFKNLFLSSNVQFPDCYIRTGNVIPLSAGTCKYKPGFHAPGLDSHGVRDLLFEHSLYSVNSLDINKLPRRCAEKECNAPFDRFPGYYFKSSSTAFELQRVAKRFLTRNQVSEIFLSARKPFTLEVLEEQQNFDALITENSYQHLIDAMGSTHNLRIGSAKSRGLGQVCIEVSKTADDARDSVPERFREFNYLFNPHTPDMMWFSITLQSNSILLDELLRFKTELTVGDLIDAVSLSDDEQQMLKFFSPVRSWTATSLIAGWNAAHKLPRENELAIVKGSVFVFNSDDANVDRLVLGSALDKIEKAGIGERLNEGFGRIRVCDEFHWEVSKK